MKTSAQRQCAREGCRRWFADPHEGDWPRGLCSPECHAASKPAKAPPRPRPPIPRSKVGERPRRAVSTASDDQRLAVKERACLVCAAQPVHPAHLIDRSLAGDGHGDPRAVVPLCAAQCHRLYDEGELSILEHLEPHFRAELAYAVERHGLLRTLERVTGQRWAPTDDEREAA